MRIYMRNSITSLLLFGLFMACSFSSLIAQSDDWQLRFMGFEEGLSHRNVYKIRQDSSGYLWFATFNGLNRYDGYQFSVYNRQHLEFPLSQDLVRDFCCHSEGAMWLAHPNALSVLRFDAHGVQAISLNHHDAQRGQEINPGNMQPVPGSQSIWLTLFDVQVSESVLILLDEDGATRVRLPLGGDYEQRALLVQDTAIWIAANENEVWQVGISGTILDRFTFPYRGKEVQEARVVHLQMNDSQSGIYAFLGNGQLFYRSNEDKLFTSINTSRALVGKGPFATCYIEENGDVWAAGVGLLYHWSEQEGKLSDLNKKVQEVIRHTCNFRQIYKDQAGLIWVASDFGALKITQQRQLFQTYLSGGNSACSSGFCSMRGIAEDPQGNIYFSYYNAIHRLNPGSGRLEPLFSDERFSATPFGLTWYRQGLVTGNGLYLKLPTLRIDTLLPAAADGNAVPYVDARGILWIGAGQTLFRFSSPTATPQPFAKPFPSRITYLHEGGRSGVLWVATAEHGVYRLDRESGRLLRTAASEGAPFTLLHDRVLSMFEDDRGILWVGTARGLHRIDMLNNRIRTFTTADGLHNDFINGILPEGDTCLWASTDNGLFRICSEGSELATFFEQDGLPANEFNRISFHISSEGRMYFGGLNGVVAFFPSEKYVQKKRQQAARLLLTNFSKYDGYLDELVSVNYGLHSEVPIRLSYTDKFFSFEFALADYTNPRENLYSYRLEGYDDTWSDPSPVNLARYNNIPAGKYQFQVRAARGNDIWAHQELSVPIHIQQAYYKSLWFSLLCLLVLAGIVLGFLRYRIYTIRMKERQLEEQVAARTSELQLEKQKSEDLLLNILPAEIAEELKRNGKVRAKRHEAVSVMFTDFRDFSKISERMEPEALVAEIDHCFRAFDRITDQFGLEKIKTIGDAYMCVGGLYESEELAAVNTVKAALEIQRFMSALAIHRAAEGRPAFEARIGIHSGPVVAGIVGIKKFVYDIWGDTVNIAARMEARSLPGLVNVSAATHLLIKQEIPCTYRGKIKAKNKGEIDMYFAHEA